MTKAAPVVRFAPSPTGYLHIGGARTALFNWLYAQGRGGKFLLRIEDTDRERNNPEAVAAILDGLNWLGLTWDGDAVSQFARADRHREVALDLLRRGAAYHCYSSPDEINAAREAAKAEGRPQIFLSPWRDREPADAPKDIKPTVRLKAPRDGETTVSDHVQGRVTFPNKDLDDLIILRSDGNPTYNLAVVVDDHDMGVTHVVRGVDHLTNTARQTQIYQGMGWDVPEFAHVPLIHGADGAKLSKRHGAQGVEDYRSMGYLPVALRNYLVRLGWSHGDDEIMSTEQLIEWFDIDDINKSASRFDFKKLDDLKATTSGNRRTTNFLRASRICCRISILQHCAHSKSIRKRRHVLTWRSLTKSLLSRRALRTAARLPRASRQPVGTKSEPRCRLSKSARKRSASY